MINNKLYKQTDTVAMGSPLGPALASIFICSFENKWLKNCPYGVKPVFHRQHVDKMYVSRFPLSFKQKSLNIMYLPNIPT